MNILGVNGALGWDGNIAETVNNTEYWVHGSGATLFMSGKLVGSICEERLTRIKYDGNYPEKAITGLLKKGSITSDQIDIVVYIPNAASPTYDFLYSGIIHRKLREKFPKAEIQIIDHHKAHAAATFYPSPYEEANVFTFDGAGNVVNLTPAEQDPERKIMSVENASFSIGNKQELSSVHRSYSIFGGFGLGNFYSVATGIIYNFLMKRKNYFSPSERETYPGKIMGLSGYGKYERVHLPDAFYVIVDKQNYEIPRIYGSSKFSFDGIRNFLLRGTKPEDMAAWVQHQFEKIMLEFFRNIPQNLKKEYLCLGGGCALNIILNSRLVEEGIYKDVFVNTAPNDDGLSFGGAIYAVAQANQKILLPENIGCIGLEYTNEEIKKELEDSGLDWEEKDFSEVVVETVEHLKENKIIAWMQGQSEFGPRALGNRSIIANPTFDNKDYLNKEVKFREWWRPYAPIIKEESVADWFDMVKQKSPYMMFNSIVKEDKKEKLPAITHEDDSTRAQTINKSQNEKAYALLSEFENQTGVPVLLNTSFNLNSEPIVESPRDAINTFTKSKIDILVMNNIIVRK